MSKRVVIVGVGALGSHLLMGLRNVDATLVAIDFDRVETKNVASQVHTLQGVGKNKAIAYQKMAASLFRSKVEAVPTKLTADNVEILLAGADLIVDAVDNPTARHLIQAYAQNHKVPCLHGALAADGTYGRVVWDERFTIDEGAVEGQATCEDGEHLPFVIYVSALLTMEVQRHLAGKAPRNCNINPAGNFFF